MSDPLDPDVIDRLFSRARAQSTWSSRPVEEVQIRQLYEALKHGATSANSSPARFVWVRSEEGRKRLAGLAAPGNRAKIISAPVTVIIGYDLAFARLMPALYPARAEEFQTSFRDKALAEATAFRNASLQGAYLMLAARAYGLDCGPLSGFDNAAVDREFFDGTEIRSNFLCSLGYAGQPSDYPRKPRLEFEEACWFA